MELSSEKVSSVPNVVLSLSIRAILGGLGRSEHTEFVSGNGSELVSQCAHKFFFFLVTPLTSGTDWSVLWCPNAPHLDAKHSTDLS